MSFEKKASIANISKDKAEKEEFKQIPMGIKWEWDDSKKGLTYKTNITINEKSDKKKKTKDGKIDLRSGVPRLVPQNRQKNESRLELRKHINTFVAISDVKNAALYMLSERYFIPDYFENYCNDKESKTVLEAFLLQLSNYFHWFFEAIDSKVTSNPLCIERSETEQARINKATLMLKKTLKTLARCYCMLILGLGSAEYHHMNGGKNRVSSGFKDRGLFETLYPFCIFFIWITFKRRDYEQIRSEIGRVLRSDAFNSAIKVESILEEENRITQFDHRNRNKEAILNKYEENRILLNEFKSKISNRKTSTTVLAQRSPALVSLLPSSVENSKWLFNRRGENLNNFGTGDEDNEEDENDILNEVGIIGQPMKLFHVKTLAARGNNEDDPKIEGEGEANEAVQENGESSNIPDVDQNQVET